jgi:hypothetical protein
MRFRSRADERRKPESDRLLDTQAAEALRLLESGDHRLTREPHLRSAWSRFIMSLLMRTPEDIAALKLGTAEEWNRSLPTLEARYATKRREGDPPTFQEYLDKYHPAEAERLAMSLAPKLMDHALIGQMLNNMRWLIRSITGNAEFLTSDRPVLTSATLTERNAYIFLPIGPKTMFVAVNDLETQQMVEEREPAIQIEGVNKLVAAHAVKYVYACDDTQLAFVQEHMSTRPQRTMLERLVEFRRARR